MWLDWSVYWTVFYTLNDRKSWRQCNMWQRSIHYSVTDNLWGCVDPEQKQQSCIFQASLWLIEDAFWHIWMAGAFQMCRHEYLRHQSAVNTLSPELTVACLTQNLDFKVWCTFIQCCVDGYIYYTFQSQRHVKPRLKKETSVSGTPVKMKFLPWIIKRISLTQVRCLYSTLLLPPLSLYRVSKMWCALSTFF